MGQIDIAAVYTTALTILIVMAITIFNIVNLNKCKTLFFKLIARANVFFVLTAAVYLIAFSYQALEDYNSFVMSKGRYDKYAITFCIYYGIVEIAIFLISNFVRFASRNRKLIKKK